MDPISCKRSLTVQEDGSIFHKQISILSLLLATSITINYMTNVGQLEKNLTFIAWNSLIYTILKP